MLTYPRTDSRALPEDYLGVVKKTFEMIADEDLPGPLRELSMHARKGLNEGYVKPTKRVFDNTKVSDHFAIIPTLQPARSLSDIEARLYDLVVKRFLAVFYPAAEFMVTTRISKVAAAGTEHVFQTNGKVLVNPGWLAVYGKEAQDEDANLVAVAPGEMVRTEHCSPALVTCACATPRTRPMRGSSCPSCWKTPTWSPWPRARWCAPSTWT